MHSKTARSKEEKGDKHLQTFHKLKPPLFKGAVGPQDAEDWLFIQKIEMYHWLCSSLKERLRDGGLDSREKFQREDQY
ncbi:hypothetical protein IEQ34_004401 [Dendrobium chrysotoxum]|uniref:Uncharacterized protein n=1 Tax=Dendrobium chrysotoxum TaxID=161865 RepID=A0AAV7HIC3_DENCH|nr:hypothetical protein IEQ34_004401 [Dendrobium chrysotoxum]